MQITDPNKFRKPWSRRLALVLRVCVQTRRLWDALAGLTLLLTIWVAGWPRLAA